MRGKSFIAYFLRTILRAEREKANQLGLYMTKDMKKYFDSIKEQLCHSLAQSARGYLKTGLESFHKERRSSYSCIQPPIGNLGIGIELMLKTFIVKNNPTLLFKNLPIELKVFFTCPDAISKDFNWRHYDIDIRSFTYKTIDLDECISMFNVFYPEYKQVLKPYFRFLSRCRNASVHASLPFFQKYDLERTAYLTIRILEILNSAKTFGYTAYFLSKEDKYFLSTFEEERTERVRRKIEAAKEKSKKLTREMIALSVEDWESYVTGCPICDSDGILTGYTEVLGDVDEDEIVHPCLDFFADSFGCEECGLILDDVEELRLSGMDIHYDRSDEIDKWAAEYESDYDWGW